ncbi:60S ribosomal protein L23 [Fomitiporia mediterranea MF3/22]|uniref:60S ribosomal protein L23 n=1 Tax=Fomitiporia mediterranea (strain MF3/22) TaxID=694068 RepID=UPI000440856A|nr:60S ribosomal protein L23 [Fomitiporia mediterranea MF3/22]EJD01712.1 60S ribosomal protein L23 [Fomitiporia mediterranea MF3/22]
MSQAIGNTALAYAKVWHHVDASGRTLGKLADRIAIVLMGKHKPMYDPGVDCGDYVVVTNARNIRVSGNKAQQKVYYSHTMYPGGLKERKFKDLIVRKPEDIIREAVSGMLPKNKLRDRRLERLRIFADEDMGAFKNNILKRWEDGTLPSETITKTS